MSQFPKEEGADGEFQRQEDAFREILRGPVEPGRYHLYISLACPWAHRTYLVRNMLGLQTLVGVSIVDPVRDERGWAFPHEGGRSGDPVNGFHFLAEAYHATDPGFAGRVTVPVLWDIREGRIVNNSEDDICRMFAGTFGGTAAGGADLFPADIAEEQAALSAFIYENVNNGVYRAGFAGTQAAYERAARRLFDALDTLDERLGTRRYLFGSQPVESDWRLFCTLIRFDAVYHGHFKCNIRRIVDYPHLAEYLRDLYQLPGVAETVSFDHIKRHYYITHDDINPTRIVPLGPDLSYLDTPHHRERLGTDIPLII